MNRLLNMILRGKGITALFTCLSFISLGSFGQEAEFQKRKSLVFYMDTLISKYSISLPGSGSKNVEKINADFKSIFVDSALIPDDISPVYFDGITQTPFKVQQRTVGQYLQRIQKLYPKGVRTTVLNHSIDFSKTGENKAVLFIHRVIYGNTNDGFTVRNEDTLALNLTIDSLSMQPKISSIGYLGGDYRTTNDKDRDFILDKADKCPDVPGLKEYDGCPPPSNPQQFLSFSISKSISAKAKIEASGFSEGGYPSLINQTKRIDLPEADPAESQFGLSLNFSNFFGRMRMLGAGIGLQYDYFTFDLTQDNFFVEYRALDQGAYFYRRVIRSNQEINESEKLHMISIPLEGIVSHRINDKLSVSAALGPVFSFSLSANSKPAASFDYGAIYDKTNDPSKNQFNSNIVVGDSWWVMTEDAVSSHASSQAEVDAYFEERFNEGYDVMNNKSITDAVKINLKPSVSFAGRLGFHYKLSSSNYLSLGIQYMKASFKTKTPDTYMVTDRVGDYSSLVNGADKLKINYIAIRIGLSVALK